MFPSEVAAPKNIVQDLGGELVVSFFTEKLLPVVDQFAELVPRLMPELELLVNAFYKVEFC